jgi:hypothetical protein
MGLEGHCGEQRRKVGLGAIHPAKNKCLNQIWHDGAQTKIPKWPSIFQIAKSRDMYDGLHLVLKMGVVCVFSKYPFPEARL